MQFPRNCGDDGGLAAAAAPGSRWVITGLNATEPAKTSTVLATDTVTRRQNVAMRGVAWFFVRCSRGLSVLEETTRSEDATLLWLGRERSRAVTVRTPNMDQRFQRSCCPRGIALNGIAGGVLGGTSAMDSAQRSTIPLACWVER